MALAVLMAALVGFLGGGLLGSLGVGGPAERTPEASESTRVLPGEDGTTRGSASGGATDGDPAEDPAVITLEADKDSAAPLERIRLTGQVVPATAGLTLQVQRSQDGRPYQPFPVTTTTDDQGRFATQVATRQTGENRFRISGEVDGDRVTSDAVVVDVG
jgi:hypothetical protein